MRYTRFKSLVVTKSSSSPRKNVLKKSKRMHYTGTGFKIRGERTRKNHPVYQIENR